MKTYEPKHAGAVQWTKQGTFIRVNDGSSIYPWVKWPLDNQVFDFFSWEELLMFGINPGA